MIIKLLTQRLRPWPVLKSRHHGFSLVETMLQMAILTALTIPMVMAVNLQKGQIMESREFTRNDLLAATLFDNVDPRVSDPNWFYDVGFRPEGLTSVYCDPATKVKTPTQFDRTCSLPADEDFKRGPFFTRDAEVSPRNQSVKVTVKLFKNQDDGDAARFYEATREYNLDHYQVATGFDVDSPLLGTLRYYESRIETDVKGNKWYPALIRTPGTPATYYQLIGCPRDFQPGYSASHPGMSFVHFTNSGCPGGMEYGFKVMPQKTYDVTLLFAVPSALTYTDWASIPKNCVTGVGSGGGETVSCFLVDISITAVGETLKQVKYFDVANAAGKGQVDKLVSVTYQVTTPDVIDELNVKVSPSTPDTGTTEVALYGVEVVRRSDD